MHGAFTAPLSIAIPMGAALLLLVLRRVHWMRTSVLATIGAQILCTMLLLAHVWRNGAQRYAMGGWSAPLGIELHLDGFSAIMGLLTAAVALPLAVYAMAAFAPRSRDTDAVEHAFWPCWLFLLGALQALYLSADVFNLYVTLEMTTLASVALVILAGAAEARRAAMRYLLAAFLGSLAFLLAVGILYSEVGTLDLRLIGAHLEPGPAAWAAVALACAGLAMKSALFPLHFWLPGAHANAPAPVSGMLSGFVAAAGTYILLRLWFESFHGVVTPAAAQLVGVLGAAGIIWGSVQAIRQQRLKLMIAYSTVAQIGYFVLVIPLSQYGAGARGEIALDAWRGCIYLMISHACAKAAMFLAAGAIARSLGSDRLLGISGIATRLPLSTYAFGIAGISLIGLPPSGGFIGKWLLLSASIAAGQWWWSAVIVVGSVLTAGYVFVVLGQELSQATGDVDVPLASVPRAMEYTAMLLAIAALLLGVRAIEPLELLRVGSPFPNITGVAE